jgi:diacylglycerol kinase family enzyme
MIGVITNPRAGKNVENSVRIERLKRILGRDGIFHETQTREEISNAARKFRRLGIDILVIDGGDGTLHHTLSAFIPIYHDTDLPPIVLLRGGTMNTVARSLGIKGLSEAILGGILSTVKKGGSFEVVRTNILKVNDRYGFIFGVGFPVSLLKAYYRGAGRGKGKTTRVFLKILYSTLKKRDVESNFFHAFKAEIRLDEEKLPARKYTAILGATVKDVGLGFKPTRRAGEREGVFQILCCDMGEREGVFQILCCDMGPERTGLTVFKALLGMELMDSRLLDRLATRCTITVEKPVDMQIDGEIFKDQKEIYLHVGPAIRFIRRLPSS